MYLKNIHIENYGPIEKLQYSCKFDDEGKPQPLVLIGKNGCGKTLVLSNIIHSLIEMKRKHYDTLMEVSENNYYRVGSKSYIKEGAQYAYINIEYANGKSYTDLMTNNYSFFKDNIYKSNVHQHINIDDGKLKDSGFYNKTDETNKAEIDNHIYLYFPVDRYYTPQWFNKENKSPHINIHRNYVGRSVNNMICHDLLFNIESWILDVIMDQLLYEEKTESISGQTVKIGYEGKNTNIISNINHVLSKLLYGKYPGVRIGVSPKNNNQRNISIIGTADDGNIEKKVVSSFANLSSGEVMIFSIACMILKEYDRITNNFNSKLEDISGIVLIDEIDIHLHSDFAKNIAPQLIQLFPRIQFIISSHSPFFLLGMNDLFKNKCQFLSLPSGILMENVEHFEEIRDCYNLIDDGYNKMEESLSLYKERVKSITKPLIITEGKTDWKHIKNALVRFQEQSEFTDLDVEFYEYTFDMGDRLPNIISNIKVIPNNHKIIAVFDTDKKIVKEGVPYDKMGNNVYQCAIPDPHNYGCGISIEMMYPEDDIKKLDNNNRRLFLTNEFSTRSGALLSNHSIICRNKTLTDAEKNNRVKIVDFGVIDVETDENIALSKEDFATNVLNRVPPFDNVNIDGFHSLFETIRQILND